MKVIKRFLFVLICSIFSFVSYCQTTPSDIVGTTLVQENYLDYLSSIVSKMQNNPSVYYVAYCDVNSGNWQYYNTAALETTNTLVTKFIQNMNSPSNDNKQYQIRQLDIANDDAIKGWLQHELKREKIVVAKYDNLISKVTVLSYSKTYYIANILAN